MTLRSPQGMLTALVIVAEIGDISRFPSARKLTAWAGLTPAVRSSDLTVRHGHISKQGSDWLRWILCEATQTAKRSPPFAASYHRDRPPPAGPRLPSAARRPGPTRPAGDSMTPADNNLRSRV
ncbi:IS110 family transposase [Streptomyces sp900116325]|uniref:IS110 family transposase n=1 Tax=Streptomyces sp. 900116325 TaxID=3154295 RepID=A0ABV2UJ39_9ACTN